MVRGLTVRQPKMKDAFDIGGLSCSFEGQIHGTFIRYIFSFLLCIGSLGYVILLSRGYFTAIFAYLSAYINVYCILV